MPPERLKSFGVPSPLATALAGMVGMAVAMGVGRFVYTPILPAMMSGLGLTPSDAGLIASANYLGYLLGALAAASSIFAGRERPVLLAAVLGTAPLTALCGLAGGEAALIVLRFLSGVTSAFAMVFLSGVVFARLSAAGSDRLAALHFGGVGLGIAASSALILALAQLGFGWQGEWYWSGALALAGSALCLALLGSTADATTTRVAEPRLPADRRLRGIILSYGLFGFGYSVTTTFLVAIARDAGATPSGEAVVWLVTGLAGLPSVWLWDKLARRVGIEQAMALACLVEAGGVAASVALPGMVGPYAGAILVGGTFIAATALGIRAARALAPASPRRALALMTAAFGLGQILGPLAAGWLAEGTGSYLSASLAAAFVLGVCAFLSWTARPPIKSR
jgi:predicted MFS family arabinose efflux permease